MPSDGLPGLGSGYINRRSGRFGDYIARDLIEALYQSPLGITQKSRLYIGGLSMGGYGALRLGLKYSTLFSGISIHSSVTSLEGLTAFAGQEVMSDVIDNENSIIELARSAKVRPALRMDCGLEDDLINENRILSQGLLDLGYEHEFSTSKGGHDWGYWQAQIVESFEFFEALELKP
jgi:S-formylglutathione hydrolase FrmB